MNSLGNGQTDRRPHISVIVPAYNAERTIARCLEALTHQTASRETYEIIVVDDGSTDGTRAKVEAHPGVRLFAQANAGPAAARNLGVLHAQGEIVLFTDADCMPVEDWIEHMVAPFRDENIVGVRGRYSPHQQELVARFVQMEYEDRYDRTAREKYIDFVDTYAAGYRRDVFVANDGFDTAFPAPANEDLEFSFRLARQGYNMVFVPEARVRHLGHVDSLRAYWHRKFKIGYWRVLALRRHPDKLFRDSHTPQVLKVQILLVGLGIFFLFAGTLWPFLWWGCGAAFFSFLLTTIPFVVKAWTKDPPVAIVSPVLLFTRALALGTGFAMGLVTSLLRS